MRAAEHECLGDAFDSLSRVAADLVQNKFRDVDAVWADKERQKAFVELPLRNIKVHQTPRPLTTYYVCIIEPLLTPAWFT